MIRSYNVYPKNKISGGIGIFHLPLRHTNSFSTEKKRNYEIKSAFPKSKKIKKLIEEIKSSNTPIINNNTNEVNNLYVCQKLLIEEKAKNRNYTDNIIQLNNYIDELELQLSQKCQHNINDEIIMLRKENEELRMFKQKIYNYSMKYDEINKDILLCLKNIEKAVELFNINNPNINSTEYKNNTLHKISDNFNSIVDNLTNFLKVKEDEYNTLLNEKENEINKLKNELNYKTNINKYSEEIKQNQNQIEYEMDNYRDINKFGNTYQTNGLYKPYTLDSLNYGNETERINYKNMIQNI